MRIAPSPWRRFAVVLWAVWATVIVLILLTGLRQARAQEPAEGGGGGTRIGMDASVTLTVGFIFSLATMVFMAGLRWAEYQALGKRLEKQGAALEKQGATLEEHIATYHLTMFGDDKFPGVMGMLRETMKTLHDHCEDTHCHLSK